MDGPEAGPGLAVPNLAYLILLGTAVVLTLAVPVRFLPTGALRLVVGVFVVAAGVMLWLWGQATMRRNRTSPDPGHVPRVLVDDGPYRFSRNPTYLGLIVVFLGVAVVFNSVWLLAFAVVGFLLDDRQVRREESYLASLLGGAYVDYRSRVRRWL